MSKANIDHDHEALAERRAARFRRQRVEFGRSSQLCCHELEILQECAGEREPRPWGAAVAAALEALRGSGYMDGNAITPKGHAALKPASDTEGAE